MGYGLFNTFYAAYKVRGKTKISWIHFEPFAMPDFAVFADVLGNYQHIMCVSNDSKGQMEALIPALRSRYRVFHNIVDVKDIWKKANEGAFEREGNNVLITSVGRLDPQKGFDIGIKVVQRLCKEGYLLKWLIIGEGCQRSQLETMINSNPHAEHNIELLGLKTNPYPYVGKCDIYFQPSRREGYGIAVAEAKALFKPIVAAESAGVKEQLIHEETGLLAKCTEDDLYIALKRLLDDEQLKNKLSENLKNYAVQYPDQIRMLEKLFDQA